MPFGFLVASNIVISVKNLINKNNTLLVNRKPNGFEFKIRLFEILANYSGVVCAWQMETSVQCMNDY